MRGKRTDMRYQRCWPQRRKKLVIREKGRGGGGEKRNKMRRKTLLKDTVNTKPTINTTYGRWGQTVLSLNSSEIEIRYKFFELSLLKFFLQKFKSRGKM